MTYSFNHIAMYYQIRRNQAFDQNDHRKKNIFEDLRDLYDTVSNPEEDPLCVIEAITANEPSLHRPSPGISHHTP